MTNSTLTDAEILARFAPIVAKSLRIEESEVTEDAYLDDLGAESLDFIEISFETEEEFRISLPEKSILDTAQDVFGEGVLVQDGLLTEEGKKFLQRRMPDVDPATLKGDVRAEEIKHLLMRVSSWVRMIRGLIESTPQGCPQCGSAYKEVVAGKITCESCSATSYIPYGEEINRRWIEQYYEKEYLPTKTSTDAAQA